MAYSKSRRSGLGPDFGRQDRAGKYFVIFAPLGERVVEMIFFQGEKGEAIKRARVYAPAGDFKIMERLEHDERRIRYSSHP